MTLGCLSRTSRDARFRSELEGRPFTVGEVTPPSRIVGAVSLRRYPFPFRCALAISNDSRECSPDAFHHIHAAFAERDLELGAAASFDPSDICFVGSPVAHRLSEAGLLDALIGLPAGGAAEGVEQLSRSGIRPFCHVADSNVADAAPLAEAGISFFTDKGFSASEKFGDGYEFRAAGHLQEAFTRFDFGQFGIEGGTGASALTRSIETIPQEARRNFLAALFNEPIVSLQTPAGTLKVFKRYSGPQSPAAPLLPLQLRSHFLDTLESFGGSVVIQQRLGDQALIGMAAVDEQRRPTDDQPLGIHELVALDDLADRSRDRILVASTGRLLTWLALQRDLEFDVEQSDGCQIWITSLRSDDNLDCVANRLKGLAFNLPSDAPETSVFLAGERLETARQADPVTPGCDCVFIPWERHPWPGR